MRQRIAAARLARLGVLPKLCVRFGPPLVGPSAPWLHPSSEEQPMNRIATIRRRRRRRPHRRQPPVGRPAGQRRPRRTPASAALRARCRPSRSARSSRRARSTASATSTCAPPRRSAASAPPAAARGRRRAAHARSVPVAQPLRTPSAPAPCPRPPPADAPARSGQSRPARARGRLRARARETTAAMTERPRDRRIPHPLLDGEHRRLGLFLAVLDPARLADAHRPRPRARRRARPRPALVAQARRGACSSGTSCAA